MRSCKLFPPLCKLDVGDFGPEIPTETITNKQDLKEMLVTHSVTLQHNKKEQTPVNTKI